jgi:hypothetical protein
VIQPSKEEQSSAEVGEGRAQTDNAQDESISRRSPGGNVAALEDKIVQQAVVTILNQI